MENREARPEWEGEDSSGGDRSEMAAGPLKDSWDQDSEEEMVEEVVTVDPPPEMKAYAQPKASTTKKSIKKICKEYDEKEKREEEERAARRAKLREELSTSDKSDRLRRRKLQEAADLSLAREVYGLVCPKSVKDDTIQT